MASDELKVLQEIVKELRLNRIQDEKHDRGLKHQVNRLSGQLDTLALKQRQAIHRHADLIQKELGGIRRALKTLADFAVDPLAVEEDDGE